MANVYIPRSAKGKMHTRHDCSALPKDPLYLSEENAREIYGMTKFCQRCAKPKTRKGGTK